MKPAGPPALASLRQAGRWGSGSFHAAVRWYQVRCRCLAWASLLRLPPVQVLCTPTPCSSASLLPADFGFPLHSIENLHLTKHHRRNNLKRVGDETDGFPSVNCFKYLVPKRVGETGKHGGWTVSSLIQAIAAYCGPLSR